MLLCFGELMLRLAPPPPRRWAQAVPGTLDATFAGAEANVAADVALLGMPAAFATLLPDTPLADAAIAALAATGVNTRYMSKRPDGRLGVYYYELGAGLRGGSVVYDRADSTLALHGPDAYDFDQMLVGVTALHLSGITPALSQLAHEANLELARRASAAGIAVSCDLNFRAALWRWQGADPRALAQRCMAELLPYINIVISNPEQIHDVLGLDPARADSAQIGSPVGRNHAVARRVLEAWPSVTHVAQTMRENVTASRNLWAATLTTRHAQQHAPRAANGALTSYDLDTIVDRLGTGDAFAAGLIYALHTPDLAARALDFATALAALKHTISGDFAYATRGEVEALMAGQTTGRIKR